MTRLLAGALCSFAAVFASAQESRTDADSAPASSAVKTALKEASEIISSHPNAAEAAEKAISDAQEYRRQALIRRFKRKQ